MADSDFPGVRVSVPSCWSADREVGAVVGAQGEERRCTGLLAGRWGVRGGGPDHRGVGELVVAGDECDGNGLTGNVDAVAGGDL